ncbi:hypothetical protein K7432_014357 [Basidiobolus ranarum]|uniref:G-protein coupled receptors family 1 profile domain-containing protein n=1 Tax=Basidiobolus ranarum TaxID=34480 RepID=A0ABR2WHR7_9FUNG
MNYKAADLTICSIAFVTYICLKKPLVWFNRQTFIQSYFFWILALIWIIPVTTATVSIFIAGYSPVVAGWCWIDTEPGWVIWIFAQGPKTSFIIGFIILNLNLAGILKRSRAEVTSTRINTMAYTNALVHINNMHAVRSSTPLDFHLEMSRTSVLVIEESLHDTAIEEPISEGFLAKMCTFVQGKTMFIQRQLPCTRKNSQTSLEKELTKAINCMYLLPTIYLLIWLPVIVVILVDMVNDTYLQPASCLIMPSCGGMLNSILYGFNQDVRKALREKFRS